MTNVLYQKKEKKSSAEIRLRKIFRRIAEKSIISLFFPLSNSVLGDCFATLRLAMTRATGARLVVFFPCNYNDRIWVKGHCPLRAWAEPTKTDLKKQTKFASPTPSGVPASFACKNRTSFKGIASPCWGSQ